MPSIISHYQSLDPTLEDKFQQTPLSFRRN